MHIRYIDRELYRDRMIEDVVNILAYKGSMEDSDALYMYFCMTTCLPTAQAHWNVHISFLFSLIFEYPFK